MNIFTHLGFSPNHREPSKVTQAVKHYAEVSVLSLTIQTREFCLTEEAFLKSRQTNLRS